MDRKLIKIVFSVFVISAMGCSREQPKQIAATRQKVSQEVQTVLGINETVLRLEKLKSSNDLSYLTGVKESIHAVTNVVERMEIVETAAQALLILDFSSMKYQEQVRYLRVIRGAYDSCVAMGLPSRRALGEDRYAEVDYDYLLRLLAWERNQVKRLGLLRPKECLPGVDSPDAYKEWMAWLEIYKGAAGDYEAKIQSLEELFPHRKRQMSEEAYNRIKVRIEDYLGRPMRTESQVRADRKAKRFTEFPNVLNENQM